MALTRTLGRQDHQGALELYDVLGGSAQNPDMFHHLLDHPGTTIHGSFSGDTLCAMVTLHILPNLTNNGRPYALIENVASLHAHRGQGHARLALQSAIDAAWAADAYKIMLQTGQDTGARGFYEKIGFRGDQKHGLELRRVPPRTP